MDQSRSHHTNDHSSDQSGKEAGVATEEAPKKARKVFFETKSMAEVYAKQGHTLLALEIYKGIFEKDPSDSEAGNRISELETRLSSRREKTTKAQDDST